MGRAGLLSLPHGRHRDHQIAGAMEIGSGQDPLLLQSDFFIPQASTDRHTGRFGSTVFMPGRVSILRPIFHATGDTQIGHSAHGRGGNDLCVPTLDVSVATACMQRSVASANIA